MRVVAAAVATSVLAVLLGLFIRVMLEPFDDDEEEPWRRE